VTHPVDSGHQRHYFDALRPMRSRSELNSAHARRDVKQHPGALGTAIFFFFFPYPRLENAQSRRLTP